MLIYTIICAIIQLSLATKPNIVFIIADDLGYNDVSFHGSNQIPTPNIDALAYSGLILNNYYVNPICTPSRSALMTGKYPIHTGMQHGVLYGAEPRGLPLTEKLLPQYLGELGYHSHIVGKWHLGSWKKEYTPLYRGFESHLGYWTGHQDYYDHTAVENPGWGLDMRRNMSIAYDLHGQYSTDVFTSESVKIIEKHNPLDPLFLYISHAAVHSGNPYEPLRAPDDVISLDIKDYQRAKYAGMLTKLDQSVGVVVQALKHKGILDKSIIVFTSDNGGAAAGFNLNAASNYPLRGVKNTLWEGGVKGAALVWSPLINKPQRVALQLMHIVDWLPTLLGAIGANVNRTDLDGVNVWDSLSQDLSSPRKEILHNIDDIYGNAALMSNDWKMVHGTSYEGQWDTWYGPAGRNGTFDFGAIHKSPAGVALGSIPSVAKMQELRLQATLTCPETTKQHCWPLQEDCLFNVREDPCERNNVAQEFPDVLARLQGKLQKYNATALPPGNLPLDERGNPKYWNYVFTNFGDFDVPEVIST